MTTDTQAIYTAAKNTPDRIIVDLNIAADVLADMGQFETGQSIMREAADLIRDQSAEIVRMRTKGYGDADTKAAVAAALMQAAEIPVFVTTQLSEGAISAVNSALDGYKAAIIALIPADAMAALEAVKADAREEAEKKILCAAGDEYILDHPSEGPEERMGRHSAVRGMMMRLGLYHKLEAAIDAAMEGGKQ